MENLKQRNPEKEAKRKTPLALDNLTNEELATEPQKGMDDIEADRVFSLEEVKEQLGVATNQTYPNEEKLLNFHGNREEQIENDAKLKTILDRRNLVTSAYNRGYKRGLEKAKKAIERENTILTLLSMINNSDEGRALGEILIARTFHLTREEIKTYILHGIEIQNEMDKYIFNMIWFIDTYEKISLAEIVEELVKIFDLTTEEAEGYVAARKTALVL